MEKIERDFWDADHVEVDDILDRPHYWGQSDDMPDLDDEDVIFDND